MEYKSTSLVPKKADILIIAMAVVMAVAVLAFFAQGESGRVAVILRDGVEIDRINLDKAEKSEITVEGDYTNTILCENGSIGVIHSDCPGGVCVQSGMIKDAGKSIVCLPNRMEIRITGASDIDVMVG
ncbi:MAG: NusG domain II-containing protein [Clostridia bacterium]|nr:NusG domain II-containing protein [Clostridia bacterium]MBR5265415.1 NusG domain II-containing protein [Clostridia bacterium]